jgi:fumarylacetoacetate (FAA) hydrolase
MKLASLRSENRDGRLVIVSRDLARYAEAGDIAPTLQAAMERWAAAEPLLRARAADLEAGKAQSAPFRQEEALSPLPRAYQFLDASSFLSHAELVRRARGAKLPDDAHTNPLMYQAGSDAFYAPHGPLPLLDEAWGADMESEVAVILDDVPMGASPQAARSHIKLVMLVNDVSLRHIIPAELLKGFGFLQGKASTAFSPVAVTPDELGEAWDGGKVKLPLHTWVNGELLGAPDAGVDMYFEFPELIAHAAKTRTLAAGSILGSGTISNHGAPNGYSCLSEKRMVELLEHGAPKTDFLRFGDRVRIEMFDAEGRSIFGAIEQVMTRYES